MTRSQIKSYFITGLIASIAIVSTVNAQGLVPCDTNCGICDLVKLGNNVITWIVQVSFTLATGAILWGAFTLMTAGESESRVTEGKKMLWTAVIGLCIILGSWVIIGTILHFLTGSSSKLPWTEIQCSV